MPPSGPAKTRRWPACRCANATCRNRCCVASSLGVIASQHQALKLYNELQVEQAAAKRFEEEMSRLQIEQSFWSTPTRIDKVARERLQMRLPDAANTRILGVD